MTESPITSTSSADSSSAVTSATEENDLVWTDSLVSIDWEDLSELYKVAPLGTKPPDSLRTVFNNSRFVTFAFRDNLLIGAGRALADGLDCAYIADVAVHPDHQGTGIGTAIIGRLVAAARDHKKIILYANPGKEGFYATLGFLPMNTAMAIWRNPDAAVESGLLRRPD